MDNQHALDDAVRAKLLFLKELPAISRDRARAFNYLKKDDFWDSGNVSGLAHRLARLLGIRNYQRRNLTTIHPDIYQERDVEGTKEYRFRIINPTMAPGNRTLLLSPWKPLDAEDVTTEMRKILYLALDRGNYRLRKARDGRLYFNVVDEEGHRVAGRGYYQTDAARDDAIHYLINYLHEKYSDEGLFIVEHILLRLSEETLDALRTAEESPTRLLVSYPPVCVNPDCSNAAYVDPYSYRISVILPAWSHRFSRMAFRRFVEKTIRMETPAHILPKICWIDQAQMQAFEKAYQRWLMVTHGNARGSKNQALKDLVDILSQLRSVYDPAELTACDAVDINEQPFILDQTSLGTKEG